MTDKQLRRLRKSELIQVLYQLRTELDKVRVENEVLMHKLENKTESDDILYRKIDEIAEDVRRLRGVNPDGGFSEKNGDGV